MVPHWKRGTMKWDTVEVHWQTQLGTAAVQKDRSIQSNGMAAFRNTTHTVSAVWKDGHTLHSTLHSVVLLIGNPISCLGQYGHGWPTCHERIQNLAVKHRIDWTICWSEQEVLMWVERCFHRSMMWTETKETTGASASQRHSLTGGEEHWWGTKRKAMWYHHQHHCSEH